MFLYSFPYSCDFFSYPLVCNMSLKYCKFQRVHGRCSELLKKDLNIRSFSDLFISSQKTTEESLKRLSFWVFFTESSEISKKSPCDVLEAS